MWVVYYSEKIVSEKWGTYTREVKEYEGNAEDCKKYIKENSTSEKPLYMRWYCF